jgi:hypothetical protein
MGSPVTKAAGPRSDVDRIAACGGHAFVRHCAHRDAFGVTPSDALAQQACCTKSIGVVSKSRERCPFWRFGNNPAYRD